MAGLNKTIWIVANWKSNKSISQALDWIDAVGPQLSLGANLKIAVCPVFAALSEVKKAVTVGNFPITVGAQDLSPFGTGAYTGEEPAELLNQIIDLAILGHSERRGNFGETDEMIAKKVQQANANKILPLVCVQNSEINIPDGCKLAAYEPVFAVGTNNPDTPENADNVARGLKAKYGRDLQVLYGGSVSSENVRGFVVEENLSGVLVGNASLDEGEFLKICKNCAL